jgi:hypothetical protein
MGSSQGSLKKVIPKFQLIILNELFGGRQFRQDASTPKLSLVLSLSLSVFLEMI